MPICCSTSSTAVMNSNRRLYHQPPILPNGAGVSNAGLRRPIVDRLVHHSEIMVIEGGSYRMRDAKSAASKKRTVKSRRKPSNQPALKQPGTHDDDEYDTPDRLLTIDEARHRHRLLITLRDALWRPTGQITRMHREIYDDRTGYKSDGKLTMISVLFENINRSMKWSSEVAAVPHC